MACNLHTNVDTKQFQLFGNGGKILQPKNVKFIDTHRGLPPEPIQTFDSAHKNGKRCSDRAPVGLSASVQIPRHQPTDVAMNRIEVVSKSPRPRQLCCSSK